MEKITVYIGELLSGVRSFPILNRQLGREPYAGKKSYRAIFDEMDFSFIELEKNPAKADFLLIPHNYYSIKKSPEYIAGFIKLALEHTKKILVFAFGDSDDDINVPHAVIFRYAGYRSEGLPDNVLIMPTQIYSNDILDEHLFRVRNKSKIPVVSFCGWAGFRSLWERFSFFVRMLPFDFRRFFLEDVHREAHKQGIYFRRKAIKALEKSKRVKTSFIIRNSYTANKNTVEGDPRELRKEYLENIIDSDFVLVVRGDANMAVRFYEALALGRIPVLIDTDWVLPLEDVIDYKKFVVFVPYKDLKNADTYIKKFWDSLSDEEFKNVQKLARETFMNYLKFDSFLRYVFENNFLSR